MSKEDNDEHELVKDSKLIVFCEVCNLNMNFKGLKDGHPQFKCPDCEAIVKVVKED